MKEAANNLIPVTMELGGKVRCCMSTLWHSHRLPHVSHTVLMCPLGACMQSPNIFFSSVCAEDDAFMDKAVEGAVLFALNQGESVAL